MSKYKLAESIPDWLIKLKPGKYTITEIEELTNTSRYNIYMRFEILRVRKERILHNSHWKNYYHWKGATYYWHEIYQKGLEKYA